MDTEKDEKDEKDFPKMQAIETNLRVVALA